MLISKRILFCVFASVTWTALCQAQLYSNPVVGDTDVPDPGVLYDDETGLYYAATTSQARPDSFPIRSSKDLVHWSLEGYIFPAALNNRPKWAVQDFWAPEIHYIQGRYYAVFAARDATGVLCVGIAVSSGDMLGPYADLGQPLVRNATMGNIDPHLVIDGNAPNNVYLVWKEDGNGATPPEQYTPIWAQLLDLANMTLVNEKHELIVNDQPWEGMLVEAPWIIQYNKTYFLFYSANGFAGPAYAIGVARAQTILGPYEKLPAPIVHTNSVFVGPGHCAVVLSPLRDQWVVIYHSWQAPNVGGADDNRLLMTDALVWNVSSGWPSLATGSSSPSISPQPVPL